MSGKRRVEMSGGSKCLVIRMKTDALSFCILRHNVTYYDLDGKTSLEYDNVKHRIYGNNHERYTVESVTPVKFIACIL